ncbi:MAG: hypothetical protein OEY75_08710, partial [Hylemonella sp.]|nr:hypothetical protein [Hylemonella sp.]
MISIICYYSKMRPFGCAPGPLDLLDDMASAPPDEGAWFLGVGVARITFDNQFHWLQSESLEILPERWTEVAVFQGQGDE